LPDENRLINFPIEYGDEDHPLLGFLGGIAAPEQGHFLIEGDAWLYDIQATPDGVESVKALAIEHDQSVPETQASDMVRFIQLSGQPKYGIYVDSSNVRGNRAFLAVNNAARARELARPIRYSVNFGADCLDFLPYEKPGTGEFAFNLLCRDQELPPVWKLHYLTP